jgi:hypothetical protein
VTNFPLVFALVLAAASASAGAADYYGDIRPVIERKCVMCHSNDSVSFSFEDPEQTYDYRQAIASAVGERRMPPWLAEPGHQDYAEDPSLEPEEMQLFVDWAAAGFPEGVRGDHEPVPTLYTPFAADLVVDVMPGASYRPNTRRIDDYRCFVMDWPGDDPAYVTGFRARPGNLRIAHHLVLFAARPDVAERFRELEAEEEGRGYQCFGGAVPDRFEDKAERETYEERYPGGIAELNDKSFWLAQWAPGTDGYVFPEDTGIRLEPGTALIVQMHYYSGFAPGESDSGTRMEFMVSEDVEKPAFYLPLSRFEWLYGEHNGSLVIPAGERRTYVDSMNLERLNAMAAHVTGTSPEDIEALEVHSANLHMHSYGSSGVISMIDRHGREEILLSVPRWNLHWQRNFMLSSPKVFGRGEWADTRISVRCTFENPNEEPVYGGYGSDEEMCFNFSYVAVVARGDLVSDAR